MTSSLYSKNFLYIFAIFSFFAISLISTSKDTCTKDTCPHLDTMSNTERTFIAVKPDGVQRGLVGKIIARFEERGYKLVGLKMLTASRPHLEVRFLLLF